MDILEVDQETIEKMVNQEQVHRCGKCRGSKNIRPRHCYVKSNGEQIISCNDPGCQCRCRTHYVCKDCGRLAPYDKRIEHECYTYVPAPIKEPTKEELKEAEELEKDIARWKEKKK